MTHTTLLQARADDILTAVRNGNLNATIPAGDLTGQTTTIPADVAQAILDADAADEKALADWKVENADSLDPILGLPLRSRPAPKTPMPTRTSAIKVAEDFIASIS